MNYRYWEDLKEGATQRYGPLTFTTELLDELLNLMGEKHPIHDDATFAQINGRKQRIIPGGFIHSITSGWIVQRGAPSAVVGMRSMAWSFVRPLYPDVPFWFSIEITKAEEIDARVGLLNTTRRVFDQDDQTYAIGRMSAVIRRRPRTHLAARTAGEHR
jgi:hypothetical protein